MEEGGEGRLKLVGGACFDGDCGIGGIEQSAHLHRHVAPAGAQIDPEAGTHGMQSTGGAVELVERSEGGFWVPCSTTLFVLSFRGVASGGPPGAPAAGFFSYGCGVVE